MGTRRWITTLLVALIISSGCGKADDVDAVTAAIRRTLAESPPPQVSAAAWNDTREFYSRRQQAPAWMLDDQAMRADAGLHALGTAKEHGLDPADYGAQDVVRLRALQMSEDAPEKESPARTRGLAEADVRITAALLTLGRDVALGRSRPDRIDSRWKARREAPDLVGTLIGAMDGGVSAWLDTIKPTHAQYAALQQALMNPAMAQHAGQLALNLERWRWMPDDLGTRHLMVNIPSYHLVAREAGYTVLEMKVVVGKRDHETPIFSGMMTTTVFSPYWNVPDSIVEGETAPAAARDPGFLARNDIEILHRTKSGVEQVDPASVNWDDPEQLKSLAFRQRPGAKNALGHVKFLFPNSYDVYLHDTPADALFERGGRAFSHGCVRVEQPEALAKWVLQDSPTWTDETILEAMHAGEEHHVKLDQPIPVHIVYFTAWADDTGTVSVFPDAYGYDATQSSR